MRLTSIIGSGLLFVTSVLSVPAQLPVAASGGADNLPMSADADPSFAVVTIKPNNSTGGTYFRSNGRHILAINVTAEDVILYVYGIHPKQILGGPAWLSTDHFDIDGVPDTAGRPSPPQTKKMMQKLLAERFQFSMHKEKRELPAYAVVVDKGHPKLTLTDRQPTDRMAFSYTNQVVLTVKNESMADFADGMQASFMDRPVVDQTGLRGRYDFVLKWTPEASDGTSVDYKAGGSSETEAPPNLYTAIQEQLGLRLVRTKANVDALVVDRLEHPSAN